MAEHPISPFAKITRQHWVLIGLSIAVLMAIVVFMTLNARGSWDFILPFRGKKILGMVLVGYAIAVSTVLFQTITNNRILTPSIMGFDALYMLIQTLLVFFLGGLSFSTINPNLAFLLEVGLMTLFSLILFRWLFSGGVRSLHLLVLVGIIFGIFFRSLTNFMQRIIDPNDFNILQDSYFASFNSIDSTLLLISAAAILVVSFVGWRILYSLDVLLLGREQAINLGVDYQPKVTLILVLVTILVSVSTALVGPVTFFGLLVANLAYLVLGTTKHKYTLPVAALIAILCLVAGQLTLERLFSFNTSLSIIIEFVGGIAFIVLLLRGAAK